MTKSKTSKHPAPPPATDAGALPPRPSRRGLLLVALGLLVAGFAVALTAILYRPEFVVLVPFDTTEETWFRAQVAEWAEKRHVRLSTRTYRDEDELLRLLQAESLERKRRVLAALVPRAALATIEDEDLVLPVADVRGDVRAKALTGAMAREALAPEAARGRGMRFVPATISTPLLFYSRARVAEAVAGWESERSAIDAALRRAGGQGLPAQYRLEDEADSWDTFDVAVLAAYWATRPYEGLTGPRVAHAAAGDQAVVDLATRAFAQGASANALVDLDATELRDALAWESVFFAAGWYHPAMVSESWGAEQLLTAAAQGQVFLGWLDMPHLFRLRGTGADGLDGFLRDSTDLGVTRVPRGVSLELAKSLPARGGDPLAARDGAWWAVPRTSPDPPLGFDLVTHLAEPEFQSAWARAFGRMPTRRDLLDEIDLLFEEPWKFAIARTAKKQALDQGRAQPATIRWRDHGRALVAVWRDACAGRNDADAYALGLALQAAVAGATAPVASADSTRGD